MLTALSDLIKRNARPTAEVNLTWLR